VGSLRVLGGFSGIFLSFWVFWYFPVFLVLSVFVLFCRYFQSWFFGVFSEFCLFGVGIIRISGVLVCFSVV